MIRADSVHSTPPLSTSALTPIAGLDWLDIKPEATAEEIFRAIDRLRKEARDEIDRLIRFLDESDDHMEREPDGDELDASWPEGGVRSTTPMEDDEDDDPGEDDGTGEWSLGFLERSASLYGPVNGRDCSGDQSSNIRCQGLGADLEDEHDGGEPDEADYEPSAGFDTGEPSLGWTVDGCVTSTTSALAIWNRANLPEPTEPRWEA